MSNPCLHATPNFTGHWQGNFPSLVFLPNYEPGWTAASVHHKPARTGARTWGYAGSHGLFWFLSFVLFSADTQKTQLRNAKDKLNIFVPAHDIIACTTKKAPSRCTAAPSSLDGHSYPSVATCVFRIPRVPQRPSFCAKINITWSTSLFQNFVPLCAKLFVGKESSHFFKTTWRLSLKQLTFHFRFVALEPHSCRHSGELEAADKISRYRSLKLCVANPEETPIVHTRSHSFP